MKRAIWVATAGFVLGGLMTTVASAAEWGDLTARFVYNGTPPKPEPIDVTKDVNIFGNLGLVDESLVVGKDGGIANIIVYLSTEPSAINPELAAGMKPKVEYDNKGGRFAPRVLTVWSGKQAVVVKNSDPTGHNTNIQAIRKDNYNNYNLPANQSVDHSFAANHTLPIKVQCNIHPWMTGYILPRTNPYTAVTDADGKFTIEKLPAGELEFVVWQEKGFLGPRNVEGKLIVKNKAGADVVVKDTLKIEKDGKSTAADWVLGRVKLKIVPGVNNLGTIKVSPQLFDK